ncbi:MAG: pilus assembly protein CpaE [Nocardioides sp.]
MDLDYAINLRQALRNRALPWDPMPGDRFAIPDRDLDQTFVVADMTIEIQQLTTGRLIRFNGTTEWALDSIDADDVVWLPWEHQLRELLGDGFVELRFSAPGAAPGGFTVVLADGSRHVDVTAESAYLRAVMAHLAA